MVYHTEGHARRWDAAVPLCMRDLSILGFCICRGPRILPRIAANSNCNFNCIPEYPVGRFRVILWPYSNMLTNGTIKTHLISLLALQTWMTYFIVNIF